MRRRKTRLRIIEARKANHRGGAIVQIGSQRRSGSPYHIANDYIRSGAFGDITYVDLCWNVNQPRLSLER